MEVCEDNQNQLAHSSAEDNSIIKCKDSNKSPECKSKESPIPKSKVSTRISMIESKGCNDLSEVVSKY